MSLCLFVYVTEGWLCLYIYVSEGSLCLYIYVSEGFCRSVYLLVKALSTYVSETLSLAVYISKLVMAPSLCFYVYVGEGFASQRQNMWKCSKLEFT